jgi:Domain of unknown function (DUF4397)
VGVPRHRTGSRGSSVPAIAAIVLGVPALFIALLTGTAGADTGTYVRIAQLAPDMQSVAMTVTSAADPARQVMLPGVPFGGLSDYQRLEPGDYVVAVRPAGSTGPPAVTSSFKAAAGTSYTLAPTGTATAGGIEVVTDDLTPPPAGRARVRVIQAAERPVLDVRGPEGSDFASGLAAGAFSPYRVVDAGPLALTAGDPGAPPVSLPVTAGANQVLSVVVLGQNGTLTAQVHVDAAGPVATPPGPVDAGFGGAASPRGPLPALVLGGLAIAAAGVSVSRSRQARRTG